jgi:hypothetical protein
MQSQDARLLEHVHGEVAFSFKDTLYMEVAYNLMLFAQKRQLHEQVAKWYEVALGTIPRNKHRYPPLSLSVNLSFFLFYFVLSFRSIFLFLFYFFFCSIFLFLFYFSFSVLFFFFCSIFLFLFYFSFFVLFFFCSFCSIFFFFFSAFSLITGPPSSSVI